MKKGKLVDARRKTLLAAKGARDKMVKAEKRLSCAIRKSLEKITKGREKSSRAVKGAVKKAEMTRKRVVRIGKKVAKKVSPAAKKGRAVSKMCGRGTVGIARKIGAGVEVLCLKETLNKDYKRLGQKIYQGKDITDAKVKKIIKRLGDLEKKIVKKRGCYIHKNTTTN